MSEPLSVAMGFMRIIALEPTLTEPPVLIFEQDGTDEYDIFYGAAAGSDGSVILCGLTAVYSGITSDSRPYASIKLDSDGEEVWRFEVIRP